MAKKWPHREEGGKWPKKWNIGPKMGKQWPFSHFSAVFPLSSWWGQNPFFGRFFPISGLQPEMGSVQGNQDRKSKGDNSIAQRRPVEGHLRYESSAKAPLLGGELDKLVDQLQDGKTGMAISLSSAPSPDAAEEDSEDEDLVAQCSATPATVAATPPCSATPFQTQISVRHLPARGGGGRCDTKIFRGCSATPVLHLQNAIESRKSVATRVARHV